jgi:DNA-binding protein HU-beta
VLPRPAGHSCSTDNPYKAQFVDKLVKKTGFMKKDARKAVDAMLDVITENLTKNEPVVFTGFGKFEVRTRKAAKRINPQTGKMINVPAKVVPAFKAGKNLKGVIAKKLKVVQVGSKLKVKKA